MVTIQIQKIYTWISLWIMLIYILPVQCSTAKSANYLRTISEYILCLDCPFFYIKIQDSIYWRIRQLQEQSITCCSKKKQYIMPRGIMGYHSCAYAVSIKGFGSIHMGHIRVHHAFTVTLILCWTCFQKEKLSHVATKCNCINFSLSYKCNAFLNHYNLYRI